MSWISRAQSRGSLKMKIASTFKGLGCVVCESWIGRGKERPYEPYSLEFAKGIRSGYAFMMSAGARTFVKP